MKNKLNFLFVFAIGIMLISCGEDDPKVDLPSPIKGTKTYTYSFIADAGDNVTKEITIKLSDFTAIGTYEKYVYQGVLSTNSNIEFVKGGSDVLELKDVTLQVKSNTKIKYNLGNISGNFKFNSLDDLNFMQQVVNELVSKKEIVLQLTYSTTNLITTASNLKLNFDVSFNLQ